jgi:prepilin-type processing-associated H-X9-DG protein
VALTKITGDGYGAGTITTADNTAQLTLKSTDADASVGPVLKLQRDSSSPAASDIIGQILFHGEDDGGNDQEYASITTSIRNPAHLSEASNFTIETQKAGDKVSRLKMNENEAVFNEDSKDIDFRVESNGNANMLFVDGGNNAVGIGSAPNTTFGSLLYTQGTPAANKPIISGYSQGNSNNAGFALLNDAGNRGIWTTGSTMRFTRTYEGNSTADLNIDSSGKIFMGTATSADGFLQVKANNQSDVLLILADTSGSGGAAIRFKVDGSAVGSITNNASSTAYNTSSDYRLKENVDYTWDATTRLKQLKPARFNFIADSDKIVDGFLAHEVSSIVPESITGEKDAVDDNGDAVYQQIDQSKLVPLLVKTIQELEARITALESA